MASAFLRYRKLTAGKSKGTSIKMVGETEPMRQWDVMGEYRRRIKKVFDREGIEIPWPHLKLYFGNSAPSDIGKSD